MTKSNQTTTTYHKNNALTYDEICHRMSQLTFREGGHGQEISELIDALQKIGYFKSFRVKEKHIFSSEKTKKPHERTLKHHRKAHYRKIKKYYKSPKQYQKERLRRKLCWLLSGRFKESEIAEMLGISRRTVIRDMNRIKPYYFRMSRSYFSKLEEDRIKEMNLKLQGKTLIQQLNILTKAMIEQRERYKTREYKRHYQIIMLDMTQPGAYGLPKVTMIPKGNQTLAYPYKIRVHVKANFEDKTFVADIGGFNIIQTTVNRG